MKSNKLLPVVRLSGTMQVESQVTDERLDTFIYPHRLDLGCFLLITCGQADLTINLLHVTIQKNDIVTLMPGCIVQLTRRSDDFRIEAIAFSREFVQDIALIKSGYPHIETVHNNPVLTVNTEYAPLVVDYFSVLSRMYQQLQREAMDKNNNIIRNLLHSFLYGIIAMYDQRNLTSKTISSSRKDEIVHDLRGLIIKHYQKERSVGFYAGKLCITSKYLSEVCKQVTGRTVPEMISEAVILDAKAQLKSSTLTIFQISDSLNFPNPSFFSKYFKQHTGMSPKEYKESGS